VTHHLPWDASRCTGELSDDPARIWREDCSTCLRRLAPEHPDPRRTSWIEPQPAPCEQLLQVPED